MNKKIKLAMFMALNSAIMQSAQANIVDNYPSHESNISGSLNGSLTALESSDDTYQIITETQSQGKAKNRYSYLEHKWQINLTAGINATLHIEANRTANSEEDDFVFAYSTDDQNYTDIMTVNSNTDAAQTAALPSTLSGLVFISVVDTDRISGNKILDSISVDELFIRNDVAIVNQSPVVSAGSEQSITLPENTLNLDAAVTDDGNYTVLWTQVSGPLGVIFTDDIAVDTNAVFPEIGIYTLRLTADDGEFIISDDVVVTVDSGTSSGTDSFGITTFYPTAAGFADWESTFWDNGNSRSITGGRDPDDPTGYSHKRGDDALDIDGNGVMEMGGGNQPRIYVNPYPGSETVNPDQFFKNVEATIYYKRIGNDGAANGGLVIGLRSGPNGHSGYGDYCDATTYYARFRHDGDWDFYKELKHPSGSSSGTSELYATGLPTNQWIGMKFIAYNFNDDSQVKLELYIDNTSNGEVTNGGEWTLVGEKVDDGSWSTSDVSGCSYSNNEVITTGGGVAVVRNTGIARAEYKYFSVREIDTGN